MINFNGISELIDGKAKLPVTGWLFTEKSFDMVSPIDIATKCFMIAENDVEEIDAEKNMETWSEILTFLDVLELTLNKNPEPATDDIIQAAIFYLENDAFM